MKKTKWIPIVVIIAAVVVVLGIVLAAKNGETSAEAQDFVTALDAALEIPSDGTAEEPEFLLDVEKLNGYEILSVEETADEAVATLRVFAPDLYSVAKQLDAEGTYTDEEELLAAIQEAVEKAELIETEVTLTFEKTENGYTPILTSEFLDALYGGVFRLYEDMINAER